MGASRIGRRQLLRAVKGQIAKTRRGREEGKERGKREMVAWNLLRFTATMVGILVVMGLVYQRRVALREMVTVQGRMLEDRFAIVRQENGKLILAPSERYGRLEPKILDVGSCFGMSESDCDCNYTLVGIEADAAILKYEHNEHFNGWGRHYSGTVRLAWK
jgi:hypothetical protein